MTKHSSLYTLAALVWLAGAVSLLSKGLIILVQAEDIEGGLLWPWIAFATGVLIGAIKARLFLFKSCQKNLDRIASLSNPRWWQFFRIRFFIFLAVVITLAVLISRLLGKNYTGLCIIGAVDLSVGMGLFLSSYAFLRAHRKFGIFKNKTSR
jgi:hypothetical protein